MEGKDDAGSDGVTQKSGGKAAANRLAAEESNAMANLQREIMVNSRKYVRLQVMVACVTIILMVVQHEVGWVANTHVGLGTYCSHNLTCPVGSVALGSYHPDCCDPRDSAQMFPVLKSRNELNGIRAVITILTAYLLWLLYKYYAEGLRYSVTRNLASGHATVLGSSVRWPFLAEFIILGIHVFPNADKLKGGPSGYLFLSMFMLFKFYLFGRLFKHYSDLNSANGKFIGALTHVEYSVTFVIKKIIKQNPFPLLSVSMLLFLASSGYALSRIDSVLCPLRPELNCYPLGFWDAMWLVSMTVLTVGYGDVYPHSHGARIVAVMAGVVGIFVATATIVLTFEFLALSRSEAKVVSFMRKGHYRKEIDDAAVRAVQGAVRFQLALAKFKVGVAEGRIKRSASVMDVVRGRRDAADDTAPFDPSEYPPYLKKLEQDMYDAILRYRLKKRWVASHDPTSMEDRQVTLLESLSVNMEQVRAAVTAVNEHLETQIENAGVQLSAPPVFDTALAVSTLKKDSVSIPAPVPMPRIEFDAELLSRGPAWMKALSASIGSMCANVEALNAQVAGLQHKLASHVESTHRRLSVIERRVGIEVLMSAEEPVSSPTGSAKRDLAPIVPDEGGKTASTRKGGPPPLTATAAPEDKGKPSVNTHKPQRPSGSAAFKSPIGTGKALNDSDSD